MRLEMSKVINERCLMLEEGGQQEYETRFSYYSIFLITLQRLLFGELLAVTGYMYFYDLLPTFYYPAPATYYLHFG